MTRQTPRRLPPGLDAPRCGEVSGTAGIDDQLGIKSAERANEPLRVSAKSRWASVVNRRVYGEPRAAHAATGSPSSAATRSSNESSCAADASLVNRAARRMPRSMRRTRSFSSSTIAEMLRVHAAGSVGVT